MTLTAFGEAMLQVPTRTYTPMLAGTYGMQILSQENVANNLFFPSFEEVLQFANILDVKTAKKGGRG
jgi:hypothetical protein